MEQVNPTQHSEVPSHEASEEPHVRGPASVGGTHAPSRHTSPSQQEPPALHGESIKVHEADGVQMPVGKDASGRTPSQVKPGQHVSEVAQRPPPRLQERLGPLAVRQVPWAQTFAEEQQSALVVHGPSLWLHWRELANAGREM